MSTPSNALYLSTYDTGGVSLYHNGVKKFDTTATGIDVTGTVNADGLNIQNGSNAGITFDVSTNYSPVIKGSQSVSDLYLEAVGGGGFRVSTTDKPRLFIQNNGDISFYEDTGTTAKFFWDASAENLGIGGVPATNASTLQITDDATTSNNLQLTLAGSTNTNKQMILGFDTTADKSFITSQIAGSAQKPLIINASAVGIGTSSSTSLSTKLNVLNDASIITQVSSPNNTDGGALSLGATGLTGTATQAKVQAHRKGNQNTGELSFSTATGSSIEEAMRIDSSGNLIVGGLSSGANNATTLYSNGLIISRSSDTGGVIVADRDVALDGTIIDFRKQNAPVGSIGVNGGRPYLTNPTYGGLRVDDYRVNPATTSGANWDNALDLGSGGTRWKDLHLSGGVYLGGVGSANKLDDYEEGIHTSTASSSSGTPTIASGEDSLSYVKIGNVVHINGQLGTVSCSGCSGDLFVTMPFTNVSLNERADYAFMTVPKGDTGAGVSHFYLQNTGGGSSFQVVAVMANGTQDGSVATLMANEGNFDLNISGTYRTA